ncbi:hypothetical protein ACI6PS_12380 [Flavobacterium sp. PLA-1-15]|uniref:hypothetical protein n=1 Tax=Flavobacterium sp. PLA-1-15 TaxID=3380533 RepID=UPI003B7A4B25
MKNFKKIGYMAFAALSLMFTSCGSDDGGETVLPGSNLDTYVNAKVDGVNFETFSVQGISLGTASRDGSFVTVTGISQESVTATEQKVITIALMDVTGPGTYTLNANTNAGVLSYFETATDKSWDSGNCDAGTATVVVTMLNDTKIEGTFTFTGADGENCNSTKNVTNGSFRGTFMN